MKDNFKESIIENQIAGKRKNKEKETLVILNSMSDLNKGILKIVKVVLSYIYAKIFPAIKNNKKLMILIVAK